MNNLDEKKFRLKKITIFLSPSNCKLQQDVGPIKLWVVIKLSLQRSFFVINLLEKKNSQPRCVITP